MVTGANRGIGRGVALGLACAGAVVAVNYPDSRNPPDDTLRAIEAVGGEAAALEADITAADARERLFEQIDAKFHRLDILVNNAGWDPGVTPLLELSEDLYDRLLGLNLKAGLFCAQLAARRMMRQGGGRIIFISSIHAHCTVPDRPLYASSKGAVNSLTRSLALDLARHGVTVNAIAPGLIEVERIRSQAGYDAARAASRIPVGRVGTPEDVAALVNFLASDASGFLTGHVLVLDGGVNCQLASYRWE